MSCQCDFCTGAKSLDDNWCPRCGRVIMVAPKHWENLDVCDACEVEIEAEMKAARSGGRTKTMSQTDEELLGPTHAPLSCEMMSDGVLTIRIGVDTLAFAALRSSFAWQMADEQNPDRPGTVDPRRLFTITDPQGFAGDVVCELLREAEDGSSLLTDLFDKATQRAIEDGSEHFTDRDEEDAERGEEQR